MAAMEQLRAAGLGAAGGVALQRAAAEIGDVAATVLADGALAVARRAGNRAALAILAAAPAVSRHVRGELDPWLGLLLRLAAHAPESIELLAGRSERLLGALTVEGLEAWAFGGLRHAAQDPARRRAFFALEDPEALRLLDRERPGLPFAAVERRSRAYLAALWAIRPTIRVSEASERSSLVDGLLRMPMRYPEVDGPAARRLYRAAVAHAAAHLMFSPRQRWQRGSLRPLQVALVSLIEDARVEYLAMQEFPGLRSLWQPFHAMPAEDATATALMARLARVLMQPTCDDDHTWVRKGHQLFRDALVAGEDSVLCRRIGSLLGNDLGQMRLQFNARTYVIEPAYRDDNLGLWDWSDRPLPPGAPQDAVTEAVRLEQGEAQGETLQWARPESEAPERPAGADTAVIPDGIGPVSRYPEWDHGIGRYRADWCTVVETACPVGAAERVGRTVERHAGIAARLQAVIAKAKLGRPVRLHRQHEGERLDLDACIEAAVSRRLGEAPDPRVYGSLARRHRDLSVLVLLDVSQSTADPVPGTGATVLTLARDAVALLGAAMAAMGDRFAIHAFCSNGRHEVRYQRVKDFAAPYDRPAMARLAGLEAGLSTRIGPALRHAGRELARCRSHRKLLIAVTDGEPADIDVADRGYLAADARKAVVGLGGLGIDVFGVGLGRGTGDLRHVFGRRNMLAVERIERLADRLTTLYLRLAR